ncbi:hypothetical protein UB45_17050 [Terrabacter sp. 28]|nr:hypothetical protein UB45_17050 [Terrabacter sp. 28]
MTARDAFNTALRDLLDDGRTPPCANEPRFTSDDPAERAAVLHWCQRCPLVAACAALAEEEDHRHGVWAGIDRSPRTRKPGRPKTTKTKEITAA